MSFGFMFLRELPSEKVEIAYVFRHPTSLFYTNMSSWKDLSGFTYGRNEVSPDSEQIEHTETKFLMRNFVSVECYLTGQLRNGGYNAKLPQKPLNVWKLAVGSIPNFAFQQSLKVF